ncbi:MAG: exonuclease SbcCD subunit D [Clostridia bacterium]|nr:exonuclease SbcCD subunit D [Clostridia bacterium]
MKFIHTGDLHLGKQMNDLSLLDDQAAVLDQIIEITRREEADAVIIAGDVYQRSSPQAEAMALFDHFVSRLSRMGKEVFIISGNHDSALRIAYLSSLISSQGIHVTQAFDGHLQQVSLRDQDGEVVVWMLPFLRPAQVKQHLPQEKIVTYEDAVAAVLRQTPIDPTKRNLLICHQFITGCETCDSEERAVGGLDQVSASLFNGFDYVALGHIHKPQRILRDTLRYAGSPLKYSFSEADHRKSVAVVEVMEKGRVSVQTVPLHPLHDVRLVEGLLEDLLQMPYSEDYVWVTVRDELVPPDAKVSLSVVFPNMLKYSVVNSKTKYDLDVSASQRLENKTIDQLFEDFYRFQNNDQAPSPQHMKVLRKVIRELEETPHEAS